MKVVAFRITACISPPVASDNVALRDAAVQRSLQRPDRLLAPPTAASEAPAELAFRVPAW